MRGLRLVAGRDRVRSGALFSALTMVLIVTAGCGKAHPGVTVLNDLEIPIAINPRCWSKSVSGADPVFVSSGKSKVIHPGGACMIHGPTGRSGPFGLNHDEGPYIGCLAMPPDAERENVIVRVSAVRRELPWSTCDENRSG